MPGNDRRPADISVPHWSNGKDAARRGEAKGGGGEEAGGRREAAYQDVREGRERYDRRSQDRLDTVGEREDERRKRRDEEELVLTTYAARPSRSGHRRSSSSSPPPPGGQKLFSI